MEFAGFRGELPGRRGRPPGRCPACDHGRKDATRPAARWNLLDWRDLDSARFLLGFARVRNHVSALLLFLIAAPVAALDPGRDPSQYVIRRWGAQSLRGNTVFSVLQTRDRYIWLGTTSGLVRYDGENFAVFDGRNTPEFDDGGAVSLTEGPDGSLFVGTTAGALLRYRNGVWNSLRPSGPDAISYLLGDRDGGVWIGSYDSGIQRWRNGSIARMGLNSQAPQAMFQDPSGIIWIGTKSRGVIRHDGKQARTMAYTSEVVQALYADGKGTLWIGTPHGLVRVKDGTTTRLTAADGLTHESVTALLEDKDGSLWAGTAGGGLYRLAQGKWSRLTAAFDGLSDDHVRSLLEDHEGNIWVGTADGLNCLSEGPFVTYGRGQGLTDTSVTAVAPGSDGSIWVGTLSGEVSRLREGRVAEQLSLATGRGRDAVLALREMRDGSVWVAFDTLKVVRIQHGVAVEQTIPAGARVAAFSEDEGGPILLALRGRERAGYCRLDQGRLVPMYPDAVEARPGASGGYPHMGLRDSRGDLLFAHRFGLSRLREGKWTLFDSKNGIRGDRVRALSEDVEGGGVWAATMGGLAYLRDDKIQMITRQQGLPENYLRLVLDDGHGHLWISSAGRVFRLAKREVLDVFAGKLEKVSPRVFDNMDGLRATEVLMSNNPGFRATDGTLWFATSKGLARVDPAHISRDLPPPLVHVQGVRVNDTVFAVDRAVAARPGRGDLVIQYAGLSYSTPERIRFRYQLEGYDAAPVDAEGRRTAYYTKIPPGRYRFRVMARNGDGPWSTVEAGLDVHLAPHFYQTGWFAGLCSVAALLAVFGVHRLRVRSLEVQRRELGVRVTESLEQIKMLRGLLPTCSGCKKIRDESGEWNHMESFISARSEANFSHGVCPECMVKLYPEFAKTQG
jgi:ligand-binding sensor domain-containing protein